MKKAVMALSFIVAVGVLAGLAIWQQNAKQKIVSDLNANCQTKTSAQLDSQRSLALIVKNRQLLAIRLETEKNYSPPGGHIQGNETPEQALSRELGEEIKIVPEKDSTHFYKVYCELLENGDSQRTYLFFVDAWSGTFSPPPGAKLKWVNSDYLDKTRADTELNQAIEYLKADGKIN